GFGPGGVGVAQRRGKLVGEECALEVSSELGERVAQELWRCRPRLTELPLELFDAAQGLGSIEASVHEVFDQLIELACGGADLVGGLRVAESLAQLSLESVEVVGVEHDRD